MFVNNKFFNIRKKMAAELVGPPPRIAKLDLVQPGSGDLFFCPVCQDLCESDFVLCKKGVHCLCRSHILKADKNTEHNLCGCCKTSIYSKKQPPETMRLMRNNLAVKCPLCTKEMDLVTYETKHGLSAACAAYKEKTYADHLFQTTDVVTQLAWHDFFQTLPDGISADIRADHSIHVVFTQQLTTKNKEWRFEKKKKMTVDGETFCLSVHSKPNADDDDVCIQIKWPRHRFVLGGKLLRQTNMGTYTWDSPISENECLWGNVFVEDVCATFQLHEMNQSMDNKQLVMQLVVIPV